MCAGLILLTMALLPTSASANSGGDTYHPAMPNIESKPIETAPKATAPPKGHPVTKPREGGQAPTEPTTPPEGEAEPNERHEAHAVPPGDGGHPPKGGGEPKSRATPKPTESPGHAGPGPLERTSTKVEGAGGGGGSSPVVPILIVVAVLAALSIGTVIYRGRTPQAG